MGQARSRTLNQVLRLIRSARGYRVITFVDLTDQHYR